jgi:hypothetical protein
VLDPEIDSENRLIDPLLREGAVLSNSFMIRADHAATMPESLFALEPARGWCYYFEKAELARQFGDWEEVVQLGDEAFKLKNDSPNDPVERFVFIEGYTHVGEWERAVELSKVSYRVSREFVGPLLCRLWDRIETETAESAERDALSGEAVSKRSEALSDIESTFSCNP